LSWVLRQAPPRVPDAREGLFLDEHMSRLGDGASNPRGVGASVKQRDGAAIAVPHEDGVFHTAAVQHFGEHLQGLPVQVTGAAGSIPGIGAAVAAPVIEQGRQPGARHQGPGKIPPLGDAAQALVQEHQDR
jgi:hypothetical protein